MIYRPAEQIKQTSFFSAHHSTTRPNGISARLVISWFPVKCIDRAPSFYTQHWKVSLSAHFFGKKIVYIIADMVYKMPRNGQVFETKREYERASEHFMPWKDYIFFGDSFYTANLERFIARQVRWKRCHAKIHRYSQRRFSWFLWKIFLWTYLQSIL